GPPMELSRGPVHGVVALSKIRLGEAFPRIEAAWRNSSGRIEATAYNVASEAWEAPTVSLPGVEVVSSPALGYSVDLDRHGFVATKTDGTLSFQEYDSSLLHVAAPEVILAGAAHPGRMKDLPTGPGRSMEFLD